jgi:predicted NACHT family NTPase
MTGLESVITRSAGIISNLVLTKFLEPATSSFWGKFKERQYEGLKQAVYTASLKYIASYADRHGVLKVLGIREPISLNSIYIKADLLSGGSNLSFTSIEDLEEVYRHSKELNFQSDTQSKISGIEVANQNQYLVVLGAPGAGKSTFLRKVGLEALKGKQGEFKHSCIPVFLELKRFDSKNISIKESIIEEFKISGFPHSDEVAISALEQGRILLLLDALDEVPSRNLDPLIGQIQDFVDRYSKNRFIISSRTAAYRGGLNRFIDVMIADFDDQQIQQFIYNWFQSDLDRESGIAEKCWESLRSQENSAIKELAYTPLLLTFLCLVYDRTQRFPDNRSRLYSKALDILLEEWAAEKRIQWAPVYQGLNPELEKVLLSEIAYKSFENEQLFFSKRELLEQISSFLVEVLNAPKYIDSEAVLDAIELQQGILIERAYNVYSFSHLTLQEFLTALYIREQGQMEILISRNLSDERWHEVFVLVSGITYGSSDNLLLKIEQQIQENFKTLHIVRLLSWVDEVSNRLNENAISAAAKRAFSIYFARALSPDIKPTDDPVCTLSLELVQNLDWEMTERVNVSNFYFGSPSFVRRLQEAEIFSSVRFKGLTSYLESLETEVSYQHRDLGIQESVQHYRRAWLHAFHLTSDLVEWSEDEVAETVQYLRAFLLVVQCKHASLRVSQRAWEYIVGRMFLP